MTKNIADQNLNTVYVQLEDLLTIISSDLSEHKRASEWRSDLELLKKSVIDGQINVNQLLVLSREIYRAAIAVISENIVGLANQLTITSIGSESENVAKLTAADMKLRASLIREQVQCYSDNLADWLMKAKDVFNDGDHIYAKLDA